MRRYQRSSINKVKKEIIRFLSSNGPSTFDEIFEYISGKVWSVNEYHITIALNELEASGAVEYAVGVYMTKR